MATLQNIRNKGPLVAIIIGVALLAFILGDMVQSGGSLFSGSQFEIAEISGESISYQVFERRIEEVMEVYKIQTNQPTLDENTVENIKRTVWEELVREFVMQEEYNELGIGVSSDELFDMVQGRNIDPIVRSIFTNPQTNQFNPALVVQFLREMEQDPNSKVFWLYIEDQITNNRYFTKYNNLIAKSLYVPSEFAKIEFSEREFIVDFNYIVHKYIDLPDDSIIVSESDINKYYDNNKSKFEQEASRDIAYVTFDIIPSEQDRIAAEEWINDIKEDFETTENNMQFVNANSDVRFDEVHYKAGDIENAELDSFMFQAEPGELYGPYLEDNAFKLAKHSEIKYWPDSVKARHILIQPNNQNITIDVANSVADSLINLINNGGDFEELARTNSADQGSASKGGDVGWFKEGQMVKSFSDTCFAGNIGDLVKVESPYGIHIIEIMEKGEVVKKVQVASLIKEIKPSSTTFQSIYSEAGRFAGVNNTLDKFEKGIADNPELTRKVAPNLIASENFIAGLESPRILVRWAFNAKKGDVSPLYELGDRFVVACLTEVREKGIAPLDQVRIEVEMNVKKEKKAQYLINKLKSSNTGNSLDATAQRLNLTVEQARNISFTSFQIPGAGLEPHVIATAVSMDKGAVSDPIEGNNGVYMIEVISITSAPEFAENEIKDEQTRIIRGIQSRAVYQAYEALKDAASIVDNRAKFY